MWCRHHALRAGSLLLLLSVPSVAAEGLQVVGAGLGRTGTVSLQAALELLGYQTYHFVDINHAKEWGDWADGLTSSEDMARLMVKSGYNATAGDNPSADIFRSNLKLNPDAKVLLSVRDSGAQWAASWQSLYGFIEVTEADFSLSFPSFAQAIPLLWNLKRVRRGMGMHLGLPAGELIHGWREKPDPKAWLAEQYEAHNALVKATVPPEQLLVFNVKQGWEPLCAFLGKDVPKVPFPHINDAHFLWKIRLGFQVVAYGWIPCLLSLGALVLHCCRRQAKRKAL